MEVEALTTAITQYNTETNEEIQKLDEKKTKVTV